MVEAATLTVTIETTGETFTSFREKKRRRSLDVCRGDSDLRLLFCLSLPFQLNDGLITVLLCDTSLHFKIFKRSFTSELKIKKFLRERR